MTFLLLVKIFLKLVMTKTTPPPEILAMPLVANILKLCNSAQQVVSSALNYKANIFI